MAQKRPFSDLFVSIRCISTAAAATRPPTYQSGSSNYKQLMELSSAGAEGAPSHMHPSMHATYTPALPG